MDVGITGPKEGMSPQQLIRLKTLLKAMKPRSVHHGDYVGTDAQVDHLIRHCFPDIKIIIHPPLKRDWCRPSHLDTPQNHRREPKKFLERNIRIVEETHVLIMTPREDQEEEKSWSWGMIRRCREEKRPFIIILPDGRFRLGNIGPKAWRRMVGAS